MGKFAPVLIGLLTGLAKVERCLIRERILESVQHRRETHQSEGISMDAYPLLGMWTTGL
jgi:hypothetical protein